MGDETTSTTSAHGDLRPLAILCLGAAMGLLCALAVLLGDSKDVTVNDAAVATVNGSRLELAEYERAVRLFASEKRSAITPADRSLILERMIEEELLLQYGIETGVVRDNPAVRTEVLRALMSNLMADLEASAAVPEGAPARGGGRKDRLADYLAHLRDSATIHRAVGEATP